MDILTRISNAAARMPYAPTVVYLGRAEVRLVEMEFELRQWPIANLTQGEVRYQGMRILPVTIEHYIAFGTE